MGRDVRAMGRPLPPGGNIPEGADPDNGGDLSSILEALDNACWTWSGTPTTAQSAAAYAGTSWATSQTWTAGQVVRVGSGPYYVLGCVIGGAGATTGSGPTVANPRSVALIPDGGASLVTWLDLSFAARRLVVTNLDTATNLVTFGNVYTATHGPSSIPVGIGRVFQVRDPAVALLFGGSGSALSFELYT